MLCRPSFQSLALWLLPLTFVAVLFAMRAASLPFWRDAPLPPDYSSLLVGLSLWWMGRAILGSTGALLPALLAQTAPLLSPLPPSEPALVMAVAVLVAALMPLLRHCDERRKDRAAALAGIAMALGVACTVHFAVLAVVPLLLLDRRRFLIYGGVGALALLAFLAPAIVSGDIRFSAAETGHGPGMLVPKIILSAVILASLVLLVAYFRLRRRGLMVQDRFARLAAGIMVAQVLAVLSMSHQPAARDMVPALLLTGPALAALWSLSRPLLPAHIHPRVWGGALAVPLMVQAAWIA